MTWPLGEVMAAVQDLLATGGDETPWFEGAENAFGNDSPPRYVWYPTTTVPDAAYHGGTAETADSLATGREHFEVRCYGRDFEEAWTLRSAVVRALLNTAFADCKWLGDAWLRRDPNNASMLDYGRAVVAAFELAVPVTAEVPTTATMLGFNHTCTVSTPYGDDNAG